MNDTCVKSVTTGMDVRTRTDELIESWRWDVFAGGTPNPAFSDSYILIDDITLWQQETWNLTPIGEGNVLPDHPAMPTPNTQIDYQAYMEAASFNENYMTQMGRPARKGDLMLIPADVWGDQWSGPRP